MSLIGTGEEKSVVLMREVYLCCKEWIFRLFEEAIIWQRKERFCTIITESTRRDY